MVNIFTKDARVLAPDADPVIGRAAIEVLTAPTTDFVTVKEALENLAVSGLSGATMGVAAGGGGAGIQRAQQYGQEKREERALETLLTEALSARDVRLRTPAETARRLTVFDLEHPFSPGKDWSQVNKIGQELADPAGTGWTGMWTGEDTKVSLPEIGATRTAPINWRVKNDEEYVAQNYVTEQDLKPAIERLMQASPAAAANFVHSHAAELFGRDTGCSRGRGGSMHLFSPEIGMMGTSGIVGPCLLQACGGGYSSKILKNGTVAAAFFGDGAVNNGAFHEGLNMASKQK
jgi:hypothetical protein